MMSSFRSASTMSTLWAGEVRLAPGATQSTTTLASTTTATCPFRRGAKAPVLEHEIGRRFARFAGGVLRSSPDRASPLGECREGPAAHAGEGDDLVSRHDVPVSPPFGGEATRPDPPSNRLGRTPRQAGRFRHIDEIPIVGRFRLSHSSILHHRRTMV